MWDLLRRARKPGVDLLSPPPAGPDTLWVAADPLRADLLEGRLSPNKSLAMRSDDGLATGLLDSEFGPDTAHLLGPLLCNVDVRNIASETADRMRAAIGVGGAEEASAPWPVLLDLRRRLRGQTQIGAGDPSEMRQ